MCQWVYRPEETRRGVSDRIECASVFVDIYGRVYFTRLSGWYYFFPCLFFFSFGTLLDGWEKKTKERSPGAHPWLIDRNRLVIRHDANKQVKLSDLGKVHFER